MSLPKLPHRHRDHPGHSYQNIFVGGGAKAHLGDAYHFGLDNPLSRLPYVVEAPFNSYHRQHEPTCLPETRIDVLREIYNWADGHDDDFIFWLNGLAGTGKSTVARTVAQKYNEQKRLGASFFFSRDGGDVSHAGKFVASIAVQLASIVPTLQQHICDAISKDTNIASKGLRDQWNQLIFLPLSKLDGCSVPSPFIIVIDALDECEGENDIRSILQLLAESNNLGTARLQIFLTSRPETPVRTGFRAMPGIIHHDLVLHHVSRAAVDHDITLFLRDKFRDMREEFEDLPTDWPGDGKIEHLVERADGLFIFAATVCRFIKGDGQWFPQDLLDLVLPDAGPGQLPEWEHDVPSQPPTWELDEIYTQILQRSVDKIKGGRVKEQLSQTFKQVLGSFAILAEPLPAATLANLLQIRPETVNLRVRHLHSVLNVPQNQDHPIRLLHPSFRDFLLDKQRCYDRSFWVDEKQTHRTLADRCIQLMSNSLKQDVCGQEAPGTFVADVEISRIEQCLPLEVKYACLYWIQHFQKGGAQLDNDDQVYQFLQVHLLHWLEALGWIGKTSEGILAISSLEAQMPADKNPNLHAFIHDAKRFALYNRSVIKQAPLQLYCSALVFVPEKSIVRKQFEKCIPPWIHRKPKVQTNWNTTLQTLEGHSDTVRSVAFSPDGKQVVSGSGDKTVRLWDSVTGALLQTLEGHSGWVNSVAFSPEGKQVVSGSDDKTVRLWDAVTGALLQKLEGHSSSVWSVAFSPDGEQVVSGSGDGTIWLWDAVTGALLQTLEGHLDWVNSVAFSPEGKQVVSGSGDGTVRLWDAVTGALLRTLEGHSGWVNSVAFSPDGKQVVSGSDDKTVRLWDAVTGALLQTLVGHSGAVRSVAFSPDDKQVVSGSDDGTARLWDTVTGALLQTLEARSGSLNSVAFSPDGKQVMSGLDDKTVRLWDIVTGALLQTLEGHSGSVNSVAFSPDGEQVVSGSGDKTARLWDAVTGALLQTLEGHSGSVNSVAFLLDGKRVVSGSDGTLRLWDAVTGALVRTLRDGDFLRLVHSVAFSPDGKQVASGLDGTVRLWDAVTGALLRTFEGYLSLVNSVAFSPDGKRVVSGSRDETVKLWDAVTGALLQTLEGHSGSVNSVVFSPDGKRVVSGSDDKTVRLWDAVTGALLQTLKGHSGWVKSVAFSPDGKQVVYGSGDGTVRLWDTVTGALLQTLEGHLSWVYSVAFSPDGKLLPTLLASNDWIVEGATKILWLPPDYRLPNCVAVWNLTLVLGYLSGRVSIIGFKEGLKVI